MKNIPRKNLLQAELLSGTHARAREDRDALPPELEACLMRNPAPRTGRTLRRARRPGPERAHTRLRQAHPFVLGPLPLPWLRQVHACGLGAWPIVAEWLSYQARAQYGSGWRLPRLAQIAEDWQLARSTLQRALRQLQQRKLVTVTAAGRDRVRVTVVRPVDGPPAPDGARDSPA